MTVFWKKVWDLVKKYWQILVGLFAGLALAINLWWKLRAQKKVMQNEIEVSEKITKVNENFSDNVVSITAAANEKKEARENKINEKKKADEKSVKKQFNDRLEKNLSGSNEELANKIGNSLGVNVILPDEESDD